MIRSLPWSQVLSLILSFEREWQALPLTRNTHYHPVKIVRQRMTIFKENRLLDNLDFKRLTSVPL
jgi:hypothetical protein